MEHLQYSSSNSVKNVFLSAIIKGQMCMTNISVLYFSIKRKWETACLCRNGQLCISAITTEVVLHDLFVLTFPVKCIFFPAILKELDPVLIFHLVCVYL